MKLTEEQWYDLAQRHANADWNSNGYLDAIKAVCADFAMLSASKPAAPEGWKLVPVEPTDAMTHVGQKHRYEPVWSIGAIYREMLAASPSGLTDGLRGALEWAIQASCLEATIEANAARGEFESLLARTVETESEAFYIAEKLEEISERITRFSNLTGDGIATRAAHLLREFATQSLVYAALPVQTGNVSQDEHGGCDARIRKWREAFDVMHRRAMNAEANVRELVSQARAALPQPVAQPVEQIGKNALVLTGAQLLEALDFIAPDRATDAEQLESEVAIEYGEGHAGKAMYCWCAEYPEEGSWVLDGKSATVAQPVEQTRALTDAEIEKGWHNTFSTNNPYCPCNLKSFTKAVRWTERTLTAARPASGETE